MDINRRGFLTGGVAAATGWMLFGKDAKAGEKAEANCILGERDEVVEGVPLHIIEMKLSYGSPMLQFMIPSLREPDGRNTTAEFLHLQRRLTVARQTATEILEYQKVHTGEEKPELWATLRKRAVLMRNNPSFKSFFRGESSAAIGPFSPHITTIVCYCPEDTEVGMVLWKNPLMVEDMHLTIPATLLPNKA